MRAHQAPKTTQQLLDEGLGNPEMADRLAHPVIVRELTQDEARRMWPDFSDTVPSVWGDEQQLKGTYP